MNAGTEADRPVRNLLICLGDQLDPESALLTTADPAQDCIWMAELTGEATHVPSHKARIVLFLSAMRHFAENRRAAGWQVYYRTLQTEPAVTGFTEALQPENTVTGFTEALLTDLVVLRPQRVRVLQPGEFRVVQPLQEACARGHVPLDILEDTHFFASLADFRHWAAGRKQLRLEYYYRELRRRHGVLLEAGGEPSGGRWNFDPENRGAFPPGGPVNLPAPLAFPPDALTRQVCITVESRFAGHPGQLADFAWPVTPEQAEQALQDFLEHRLPGFGTFQDALWTGEPWLYHSRLAAAMNLKLLPARRVVALAEQAYRDGRAPLAAVEGFIRQILGWREYVRGIYWGYMPEYLERNALAAHAPLPDFYWTGQTDMRCLAEVIGQTLRHGYAHHIQRLMVTGLYALLYGVSPKAIHAWYLAVYVDAVEWVELPNTLGMSQFADGGLMASKPYCATGRYLQRMSNYCTGCRYVAEQRTGDRACPFTTLYWDFLLRHADTLRTNPRMAMQLRNLERLDGTTRAAIVQQAQAHRRQVAGECAPEPVR